MGNWAVGYHSVKYGECLVCPVYSKEKAEEVLAELKANPPEKYKDDVAKYGDDTFFIEEVPERNCWWDDPVLCN